MKLLVVGIDGGSWDVLEPMLERGMLPNIAKLMQNGSYGTLKSVHPPMTMPSWQCYSTGRNPGQVGIFGWTQYDREEGKIKLNTSGALFEPTLWYELSVAHKNVAIINIPTTYPPPRVNGVFVAGMPPNEASPYFNPPGERLTAKRCGYKVMVGDVRNPTLTDLKRTVGSKFKYAKLKTKNADFLHLTVYASDYVQHFHYGEKLLEDFWVHLDKEIGELISFLGKGWNAIIMSDHGFTKLKGTFYPNEWLASRGWLFGSVPGGALAQLGLTRGRVRALMEAIGLKRLADAFKGSGKRLLGTETGAIGGEDLNNAIDWNNTLAIADSNYCIYCLERGIAGEIKRELEQLPYIGNVMYGREIYRGKYLKDAPDLVFTTKHGYNSVSTLGIGKIHGMHEWKGCHTMDGVLILHGPAFKKHARGVASILDLYPTILSLFKVKPSRKLDGNVLKKFLREEYLCRKKK